MSKRGPIIIVDDDHDDLLIFEQAIAEIKVDNQVLFFSEPEKALEYLITTTINPFIIFSDINMPRMTGLEFRQAMIENEYLKRKSIPFIFFSTAAIPHQVRKAYDLYSHGFFEKHVEFQVMVENLKIILSYWLMAKHPVVI